MQAGPLIESLVAQGVLPGRPLEVEVASPSATNQNCVARATYADRVLFIKLYPEAAKAGFDSECKYLRAFAEGGLAVPETVAATTLAIEGNIYHVVVTLALQGVALATGLERMDRQDIEVAATAIVEAMAKQKALGSVALENAGEPTPLGAALEKTAAKFAALGLSAEVTDTLELCRQAMTGMQDCGRVSYVTHDWRLRHIFMQGRLFTGLLDFEYVRLNDFAVEVGHLLHDVRMHDTSNAMELGRALIENLAALQDGDDPDFVQRVQFYMTKQALAHVAARMGEGRVLADYRVELALAKAYQLTPDVAAIFRVA